MANLEGINIDTHNESWLTGFLEGDGSISFETDHKIPRVTFVQKEREVLDYVTTIVGYGKVLTNPKMFQLNYNGKKSIYILEALSMHVVSNKYLARLNTALKHYDLPTVQTHAPTIDWLSGFFDAEGTSSSLPSLHIGQKERDTLDAIMTNFGGGVYQPKKNTVYMWALYGKKAKALTLELIKRSHNPPKVLQLTKNFEGPTFYEQHKEKITKYLRTRYQEHRKELIEYNKPYTKAHTERRKQAREYIRTHPEEVAKILAKHKETTP